MRTVQERLAFFDEHWPAMKDAVEQGGAAAVVEMIGSFRDALERRTLYRLARRGLVMQDWEGKSLDQYLAVARAGIDEMVALAEASEDGAAILNEANSMSYDLAADLADCWPGDDLPRTRAHLEAGLRAGLDCVRWRDQLDKPHAARSLGHWAEGIHRLLLGDGDGAATAMQHSLDEAQAATAETGADTAEDFSVILASGYVALAQRLAGDEGGRARYDEAIARFTSQLEDTAKAEDARFGIDQLEKVRARILS